MRYHLRSINSHQLMVPKYRLSTDGGRSFAVAGPILRNTLPDYLEDASLSAASSRRGAIRPRPIAAFYAINSRLDKGENRS